MNVSRPMCTWSYHCTPSHWWHHQVSSLREGDGGYRTFSSSSSSIFHCARLLVNTSRRNAFLRSNIFRQYCRNWERGWFVLWWFLFFSCRGRTRCTFTWQSHDSEKKTRNLSYAYVHEFHGWRFNVPALNINASLHVHRESTDSLIHVLFWDHLEYKAPEIPISWSTSGIRDGQVNKRLVPYISHWFSSWSESVY